MIKKFWLVHTGYYPVFRNVLIAGGGFERVKMPFLFGVAEHSEYGPVLMDAPFDERGPANMGAVAYGLMRGTGLKFDARWSVAGRLDELGFSPEQVDHVLVTHMHADHTGGMGEVADATFHISRREWEYARQVGGLESAIGEYSPADYMSLGDRMKTYDDLPALGDRQGLDLFGDGSVEMYSAPGHTPGHCVYRIHVEGGETIFYGGDAAHTIAHAMGEAKPGLLPRQFTDSLPQAERSLAAIRAHLDEFPDDFFVLCHDPVLGERVIGEGGVEFGG